jgi:putative peptidoglycan lipid II flippase
MVPLGVFGMGMATAAFPTLADLGARARFEEQRDTFLFALRLILYLTIPAALGLIVLATPIVALLMERGAFGAAATSATAFALSWYAVGLPGHATVEIVDRVFYAERDTTTPLVGAAAGSAVAISLGILLMRTELSFGGLALANSVAALLEAALLGTILHRRLGWIGPGDLVPFLVRVALAAAVMALGAWVLSGALQPLVDSAHTGGRVALVAAVVAASGLVYYGASLVLGIEDARHVTRLAIRRG